MVTFHESPWIKRSQEILKQTMRELEVVWPAVKDDPEVRAPVAMAVLNHAMNQAWAEALERRERSLEEQAKQYASNPTVNVNVGAVFQTVNIHLPEEVSKRWVKASIAAGIVSAFLAAGQLYKAFEPTQPHAPTQTPTATPTPTETRTPTAPPPDEKPDTQTI